MIINPYIFSPASVFVAPVSDLVASNPTDTTMDLDWTAPTGSDNAIDYYEVWVDGVFYENTVDDSVTWTVTGLTLGDWYKFQLITVDVLGNKSELSNAVIEGTTGGTAIPTGNLVLYQRLNNNVNDQTGNHNPTESGITYDTGIYSGAANESAVFNNANDKITVPTSTDFDFGNGTTDVPFSLSLAVRPTTLGTAVSGFFLKSLIVKRSQSSGSQQRQYQLIFNNIEAPNISFQLFDQSTGGVNAKTTTQTFSNDTNYHVVVTYDGSGSNSGIKIYIDGALVGDSDTSSGSYTAMEAFTTPLNIGYTNFNSFLTYFGKMDGVGVWNKELSASEITSIFNKQSAGLELL